MNYKLFILTGFFLISTTTLAQTGVDRDLLIGAYHGNHHHVKQALIDGANINVRITESMGDHYRRYIGWTALMFASESCNRDILSDILQHASHTETPLYLNAGIPIYRTTPLIFASSNCPDGVRWLVDSGAVLDVQNYSGTTALMQAVSSNNEEIVEYLLSKGAKVNIRNSEGNTALRIAEVVSERTGLLRGVSFDLLGLYSRGLSSDLLSSYSIKQMLMDAGAVK